MIDTDAPHGTRRRYASGCRCLACSRSNYRTKDRPSDLRWPVRFLTNRHGEELILEHVSRVLGENTSMSDLREYGLGDFDADAVAVSLGDHPAQVWPGWAEAVL